MWDDYDVGRQVGAAVSQMKTISEISLEELPGLEEKMGPADKKLD